jgi:hypothetical protein
MTMTKHNKIMVNGPKAEGTYIVESHTATGESLGRRCCAISKPECPMGLSCGT